MTTDNESVRKDFEAEYRKRSDRTEDEITLSLNRADSGDYFDSHAYTALYWWQASRERYEPKWVSVRDAMPEIDQYVLWLYPSGAMSVFEIDKDEGARIVHSDRTPTHWMPLPATPNGGNEE